MTEQSHKDEMRAALRGDFERLQARRGHGEDAQAGAVEPGPEASGPRASELVVESASVERTETEGSSIDRSWLDRLLHRR
jgi:hypothetical protein